MGKTHYIIIGVVGGVSLLAGIIYWTISASGTTEIGQFIADQGREHIEKGAKHPAYNSNPPTSGWHYTNPADWGVNQKELADEQLIHNLEHGGIWISYSEKLDGKSVDLLEKFVDGYSTKVILTPRVKNDSPIVVAAWNRLLKLDSFDEQKITEFIKAYKDKGPEFVP